jgi:hypothetical protein
MTLKEKQVSAENSINRSVYLRTASFLLKYNAFNVNFFHIIYIIKFDKIRIIKNVLSSGQKNC